MERLGRELEREIGRFGVAVGMAELLAAWPELVGEGIARNAWPARVARDGTLHVATSSSAWAFELGLLEADLLERIQARLGPLAPPRLRFAPGRLPEPPLDESASESERRPTPSSQELEEAARIAAPIADENLRKLVARAAAASLARGSSDRPV